MYELKKSGKVFMCESVGNGPSSYKKRICRAAVSQSLRNTALRCVIPVVYVTNERECSQKHNLFRKDVF